MFWKGKSSDSDLNPLHLQPCREGDRVWSIREAGGVNALCVWKGGQPVFFAVSIFPDSEKRI